MRRTSSLLSIIAWDGFLPMFAAAIPLLIKLAFPRIVAAHILTVLLLPFGAAGAQSELIEKQLMQACRGRRPWHRQIFAAGAIILLLIFELGVCMGTFFSNFTPATYAALPASSREVLRASRLASARRENLGRSRRTAWCPDPVQQWLCTLSLA